MSVSLRLRAGEPTYVAYWRGHTREYRVKTHGEAVAKQLAIDEEQRRKDMDGLGMSPLGRATRMENARKRHFLVPGVCIEWVTRIDRKVPAVVISLGSGPNLIRRRYTLAKHGVSYIANVITRLASIRGMTDIVYADIDVKICKAVADEAADYNFSVKDIHDFIVT